MKDKFNIVVTSILFIFSILFSIIGFLVVDKLSSIQSSIDDVSKAVRKVENDNYSQDRELLLINDFLKNKFNFIHPHENITIPERR